MESQHASQDPEARQEIQNLYRTVGTLSELLIQQQNEIDRLERRIENSEDVANISMNRTVNLEEEVEELQEQIQEITSQSEEDVEGLRCPECGDVYETASSMSSHIGGSKDHKQITSYYNTGNGFYNPITGEVYSTKNAFSNSWSELDTNATIYLVENYETIEDQVADAEQVFSCPQCGDEFDSIKGIQMHTANASSHTNAAEHFKVAGEYVNPVTGRAYDNYESFRKTWDDLDHSITSYYYQHFGELPAQ